MLTRQRIQGLIFLATTAIGAGCISVGRPLPPTSTPTVVARAQDIPLVPIPPPPLGQNQNEESKPAPLPAIPASMPNIPAVSSSTPPTASTEATIVPASATTTITPRQLYETALSKFQHVDSYIVRLTRREMVKGEMNPEEIMLFKFRKNPWSIYFKWLSKEGAGREVLYVKGRYEDKIHTVLAAGDIPFMPAGKRMALSPDNILVRSATRHPITQAGIAASIDKIGEFISAIERGDRKAGTVTVIGPIQRPEFEKPAYAIEHVLGVGFDPSMPRGGTRWYYFDPENGLPMLITAKDERGQEVEYYRYDRLQPDVNLDDSDFDPDSIWAKPK